LQLRHNQLVPSLHADPPNPNIDFANSPFYVQTELAEWKRADGRPRRVGVSSFGAGGSNAHVILEEYVDTRAAEHVGSPEAFILSARNHGALRRHAQRIIDFLGDASGVSLADIAYTCQVGRTPMDARLAIITASKEDLADKLTRWLSLSTSEEVECDLEDVHYGNVRTARSSANNLVGGHAGSIPRGSLANGELRRSPGSGFSVWTSNGRTCAGARLPGESRSRPIHSPERYWIAQGAPSVPALSVPALSVPAAPARKQRTYYPRMEAENAGGARRTAAGSGPNQGPILVWIRRRNCFDRSENGWGTIPSFS
jgi:polyketide synthase PksN